MTCDLCVYFIADISTVSVYLSHVFHANLMEVVLVHWQWHTEGEGLGGSNPPPNSEVLQNPTGMQIEWKMFSVLIPTS
jgi:hypothetical protein